ncbi:hypothetical protein [Delftia sp.]|uniref:hypothetical protein n=1 Tax=Delftia sp. TaxID=1886637 RepID=UPI00259CFEF2|nr:hypothetical protein [Delftia sp.]
MTRDEILDLARKAGFLTGVVFGCDGEPVYPLVEPRAKGCFVELERLVDLVEQRLRESWVLLDLRKPWAPVGLETDHQTAETRMDTGFHRGPGVAADLVLLEGGEACPR